MSTKQKNEHRQLRKEELENIQYAGSKEEETPPRSQISRRKRNKKRGEEHFEISTHSNRGNRNKGLKININMKGLDQSSLTSEKALKN